MAFDVDAYLASRQPWGVTIGGVTYPARWVSVEVIRQFEAHRAALDSGDLQAQLGAIRRLLRALWPWRPHYLWRGDPVQRILALDPVAIGAVLTDFFQAWVAQLSATPGAARTATSGIDSPPSTATPSPTPAPDG